MPEYHVLRRDREIVDPDEIMDIVRRQAVLTIGMARDGVPYLVTVNYAYDASRKAFYFHSARAGKKVDYLEANPSVWCQILEDRGYLTGRCDWSYRSVHFPGTARFVRDADEARHALSLLLDKLEPDPGVRQRLLGEADLGEVAVCRIDPGPFTGKENPGPAAGG